MVLESYLPSTASFQSPGRTVFFGPAPKALDYFTSQGFTCPPSFNSADYFLDIISLDLRAPELEVCPIRLSYQ